MAVARRGQTLSTTLIGLAQNAPTDLMKIGLVGYAIWTILQHPASANPGSIVAIIGLVPTLMSPVQSLAAYSITVANGWPSVDTLDQIMNHPEIATERGRDSDPAAVKGLVDLENVHFTYSGTDAPILDGASFQLEPGKIYGLAARMGAGKSTLLRLLLRFFEPQSGTLRLDGRPLDEYRLEDLRTYIGYMHQFPVIFPDTVRENLRMAKPDATDAELLDVCARTGIDWRLMAKLASAIPAGGMFLDAAIQDGRLSGGETKLFALTRSLLRKPKVMLLDEPTAGMDNLEKQELIPTLQKALEAVTVLVVEHDPLWLSRLCAEIIVLDAGRVVESGPPDVLLAGSGLFHELVSTHQKESKNGDAERPPFETNKPTVLQPTLVS
jgi:ABC-type multidrug transport system fused ATPase/permease subunit